MFKRDWKTVRRLSTHHTYQSKLSKLEQFNENFVFVGEGVVPNLYEELLARLEQHGVRRTLISEDATEYDVAAGVDPAPGNKRRRDAEEAEQDTDEGLAVGPEDKREPYYYLCVPCELRLTAVSERGATEFMLHDVHYHVSSADHQRFAAIMGDESLDVTLQRSPHFRNTKDYARIYVNGVPMLMSLRPGGGDLFHHLHGHPGHPAARHAFTNAEPAVVDKPSADVQSEIQRGALFPRSSSALYWYNPLPSVFTWCRQLCFETPARNPKAVRGVHRIPLEFYMTHSPAFSRAAPLFPVVLPLTRGRAADFKAGSKQAEMCTTPGEQPTSFCEAEGRAIYIQSKRPICHLPERDATSLTAAAQSVYRIVVCHEHAYRVVLVSLNQLKELDLASRTDGGGTAAPALTVEMLKTIGYVGSHSPSRSVSTCSSSGKTFSVSS